MCASKPLSKVKAAQHLLDEALIALLDRNDPIAAIVLGGAAEDVFQGLLKREGREGEAARVQLMPHIREFVEREDPGASPMAQKTIYSLMRSTFDWLRHADRDSESHELDVDVGSEALIVLYRAAENRFSLTGQGPSRMLDLVHWERSRNSSADHGGA